MNQRQFEEIEDRIREAAEAVSPSSSEENWEAMNLLLDREFPEKRRRKIFFFWFWPLLGLSVAGAILLYSGRSDNKKQSIATADTVTVKAMPGNDGNAISEVKTGEAGLNKRNEPEQTDNEPGQNNIEAVRSDNEPVYSNSEAIDGSNKSVAPDAPVKRGIIKTGVVASATKKNDVKTEVESDNVSEADNQNNSVENELPATIHKTVEKTDHPLVGKPVVKATIKEDGPNLQDLLASTVTCLINKKATPIDIATLFPPSTHCLTVLNNSTRNGTGNHKISPSRSSGFYAIAAASLVNNSAVKAISGGISGSYGVGIGYRINKRLSVQTGFYAGKKKYSAGKSDYYFAPGSYYTTVDMLDIDADCSVYDIPVTVRYDVVSGRKNIFYATAGISSYIMKRESYVYSYMKAGMNHIADKTYTGNSHFLSVAGISAGYERKLSHSISLLAEPFIKIPLAGVGEGKVKLHSTGLLLGLKYTLPRK